MADFYKDNYKEGMTVYLLYTGYDLCVRSMLPVRNIPSQKGLFPKWEKLS